MNFRQIILWLGVLVIAIAGYGVLRVVNKPPVSETISVYGGAYGETDVTSMRVDTEKISVDITFSGGRYWKKDRDKDTYSIPCKDKQIRTFFNGLNASRELQSIEAPNHDLSEWDLGEQASVLTLSFADGKSRRIYLGAENPAGKGVFIRFDDEKDRIYLFSAHIRIAAEAILFQIEEDRLLLAQDTDILSFAIDAPKSEEWQENHITCELRADQSWYISRPVEHKADAETVKNYLTAVTELQYESKDKDLASSVDQTESLLRFKATLKEGKEEVIEFFDGPFDMMGQKQYIVLNRRTGLAGKAYSMVFHTVNQSFISFIWRRLFSGDPSKISKITMERGNRVLTFQKPPTGKWRIIEYFNAGVDLKKMNILLEMLAQFRVSAFISNNIQDLEQYGLKVPVATLSIEEDHVDGSQASVFYFGSQIPGKDEVYFKAADANEIYAVNYQFLRNLSRPARAYVDTKVMDVRKELIDRIKILKGRTDYKFYLGTLEGWHLKEPVLTKNINSERFEKLLATISDFGYAVIPVPESVPIDAFDEKQIALILDIHSTHTKQFDPEIEVVPEPEKYFLLQFSKKKDSSGNFYAKNNLTNLVFTVEPDLMSFFHSEFVDTSVFMHDIGNTEYVKVEFMDSALEILKGEKGWGFQGNPELTPDSEAIRSYISFLKDLNGNGIHQYRTTEEEREELGLAKPVLRITVRNPGETEGKMISISARTDKAGNGLLHREGEVYIITLSPENRERLLVTPEYFMLK